MRENLGGRPRIISDEIVAEIRALSGRLSNRGIARKLGISEWSVRNALASIPPEPTAPPSAPESLTSGERRLWRAVLLQAFRDATSEPVGRERQIERIDAQRFFRSVERARDLETIATLANLEPGLVIEAMRTRRAEDIRGAIDTETRLFLNLGMDL